MTTITRTIKGREYVVTVIPPVRPTIIRKKAGLRPGAAHIHNYAAWARWAAVNDYDGG